MKNLVLCIILNFLFFVNIVYSVEIKSLTKRVAFRQSSAFNLTCDVSYEGESKPTIVWVKDSKNISDIEGLKSRYTQNWENGKNILTIEKATEGDAGNYTCVAYQDNEEKARASILAETAKAIAVKIDSNINVVEEERLRIECKVVGEPTIYWKFENVTYETSKDRVVLENYTDEKTNFLVRNGVFIIEKVTMDDRGIVTCIGEDYVTKQSYESQCQVRVKGKYAALWPFLGICAEVIVLCAIIVIYEKKRNKTELEESDTDQSPDQKNTPDHGKEANLRHRQ